MKTYYWAITLSLSLLIILTRALPFLIANFMTERFNRLGKLLPAYIMLLLVIYEINIKTIIRPPYGLPALLALCLLLGTHLWLRNTFLSLVIGTTSFLCISHLSSYLPG
ncbi:AzlD domain-containing protein [Legionella nagasakiensis]|uniref:AzlD domain-containing protein n=1 Tax=Legionella nagasakiensis TaxID=535290 RepID=UPI001055F1C1|nr:AzlD domain-containing protein [Legionella nagasakiensis]